MQAQRVVRTHSHGRGEPRRPVKIVITGPFSAGKTTLIRTISEITVVGTDRAVTDGTSAIKSETTVAMDFGKITVEDDIVLHLFGTPGQQRFDVMWEILSEGMIAFIVLVRADDPVSITEGQKTLETFKGYADVPHVVGVTHIEDVPVKPAQVLASVRAALGPGTDVPVVACDPRSKEQVKETLLAALMGVLRRLELMDPPGPR